MTKTVSVRPATQAAGSGTTVGSSVPQPATEGRAPQVAAPLVREHVPRDAVQPQPGGLTLGHVRAPAPRDQETLGHHVRGVGGRAHAAQRVAEDGVDVRGVQPLEGVDLWLGRATLPSCPARPDV